jgi:predicted branched-subunit amino acid permease
VASKSPHFSEFLSGVRAEAPLLIGVVPFGMIYGVLALGAGLAPSEAQAMSAVIFAGSSQFITTQLVGIGAPGLVIILTVAVVNLRHALYSLSISPFTQKLRPVWKWILAYLLTDEAYAVTILHYTEYSMQEVSHENRSLTEGREVLKDDRHWFFLGAGLTLWSSWQLSTAAGIILGAVVPESWSLDFTLSLIFIALVVPVLKDWSSVAASLTAGIIALLSISLPYRLGLLLAALTGIAVGMLLEKKQ